MVVRVKSEWTSHRARYIPKPWTSFPLVKPTSLLPWLACFQNRDSTGCLAALNAAVRLDIVPTTYAFSIPVLLLESVHTHTSVWARTHYICPTVTSLAFEYCSYLLQLWISPKWNNLVIRHLHVNIRQAQIMSCGVSSTAILRCWQCCSLHLQ